MQPELNRAPSPHEQRQFEAGPAPSLSPEQAQQSHEQQNNRRFEQPERGASNERFAQPPQPPALPMAPQQVAMPQAPTQPPMVQGAPVDASDDDVIEKAWVDRIKQVLRQTADDPRSRELAIAALRRDYLAKRYNKYIKKVDN